MFIPSIYIEDQRIDLWGDETIQLTDSIRNLRNPDSFFSAYTQQFSVPATPKNNSVFSHYYNPDIVNGFDARIRHDAEIRINGVPYRKGQIKLNRVQIKHDKPSSYDIVFYGEVSKIKQELANTRLSDLGSLARLNHDYTGANVKAGFELGLYDNSGTIANAATPAQAEIVYPFISHTTQYVLDTSKATYDIHPIDITDDSVGLKYTDLKPAIRVNEVIDAIESDVLGKFDTAVTIDRTGFLADAQFDDLWIWCHKEKGGLVSEGENFTGFFMSDATVDAAEKRIDGVFLVSLLSFGTITSTFKYTINTTGAGNYDVLVVNQYNGKVMYEEKNRSGDGNFTITVSPQEHYAVVPNLGITSDGTITSIDSVTLEYNSDATNTYSWSSVSPNDYVEIPANMPDMSCLDFLTSLFKMFNLTIERRVNTYYIETLDTFYAGGTTRDITPYVDQTSREVLPPVPFDNISFKFEEPGSYLIDKRIELVGETYGDEFYSTGSIFENNNYDVNVGFEKILFERMTDLSDDSLDNNMWAWCADPQGDPYIGKPILFFYDSQISGGVTQFQWDHAAVTSNTQAFCSNTVNDTSDWTLTFGSELGEFTGAPIGGDLFTEYWENYITGVYAIKSRTVMVKAWLPASFITNYTLADTIRYKNKEYFINEMTIDIRTGEADLELVTKWL